MHLDVIDLRKFYYRTKLGRIVQRALRDNVERLFGDTKGQTVVGYGFAAPMLRPFLKSSRRVICLMPGQQGVMPWPEGQLNRSVLTPEISWPLANGIVDKMVILHGLETSNNQNGLLEEIWRVLMTTYVILDFATLMIYGFAAQKVSVWLKSNPKTLNTISACVLLIIALYVGISQNY